MKGYIYITLKSDLCVACGDGFSLSIDTDICADKYGFPFIPSRRLKGCLREAAKYTGCHNINKIFGVSGDVSTGSLRVKDARLEDFQSLEAQAIAKSCSAEQVLTLFTSVKASTPIEDDVAKENSLRFTRVVNHFSPFDESELRFVSEITYAKDDEDDIIRICKALRNIGYKRTRGYGSVKCDFKPADTNQKLKVSIPDDETIHELRLTVKLNSPAMFAGNNSMETLDYIPGNAVLGAFAAGYLKSSQANEEFERLFLSGALKFSNMYISNEETVSEPAPSVLGKTKDSKEVRYIFREDNSTDKPLPKAFKGGYLIGENVIKVFKETIYHNGQKQGEKSKLLYTQECLCEGQLFSGQITGSGKDLRKLLSVFEEGRINLGRSKSAQYSACDIVALDCVQETKETVDADEIYALLCSDVLLIDENAGFSTDISTLAKALNAELSDDDKIHSSLRYKTVMGYISVGRYKRSHIRAFEKGSVLRFTSKTEMPKYITIGERQNEGFGVIRLCTKNELKMLGRPAPKINAEKETTDDKLSELIEKNSKIENLRKNAFDYADEKYGDIKNTFTSAFIGRLLLMVGQASDESDLLKRVDSVKTESKREAAKKFINDATYNDSE